MINEYDSSWENMPPIFSCFYDIILFEVHADIDWRKGYEGLDTELQVNYDSAFAVG